MSARCYLFANAEYPAGMDLGPRVEDYARQALLAGEKGFIGVAVGQHLSIGDLQWFPPLPFLSYLAARCPGMRFALTVVLLPHTNPGRPPLWLGSSSPRSARAFGRYVDALVMSAHIPLERQAVIRAAFFEGRPSEPGESVDCPVIRNVFVAGTREEALRQAMPYLEHSYAAFDDWGLFSRVLHEEHPGGIPESVLGRVILGDPDDVVQGLRLTSDRIGTRTFIVRMQWKGMPSSQVENAIELFGDHVLPLL